MKAGPVRRISSSLVLVAVLVAITAVVAFAGLTPPGSIKQYSWDPDTGGSFPKWTNGNDPGYWEGETAAMAAEIVGEAGMTYDLPICLQLFEASSGAYGFTGFAAFNTTTRAPNLPPPALPGGEAINYAFPAPWDTGSPLVYGYNLTINSVSAPVVGAPNCNANEIGLVVNYTPQTASGAYIVWGGHIAKGGDPLPAGAPDLTVPMGKSAGYVNGNFQARLRTLSADKTLPFKVLFGPAAVSLRDFTAAASSGALVLVVLAALAGVGVVGLVRRRSLHA